MLTALVALLALQAPNTLSDAEVKAGWKLLFDGKTTHGWHNFMKEGIGSGWVVKDGALTSEDPGKAGDIVTDEQYDWFELIVDFKLTPGGNSGIMFHVQDTGEATWHSGPEIQIYDNGANEAAQKSGWLYQLYSSDKDSTKPVGEWNEIRLLVTPKHCETDMNGVKYYDFVLDSDDFKARVAKSKFAEHEMFASKRIGRIAIQGDHGVVSFRNMKIRPIKQ
jgi:hypothetical protein